MKNFEKQLSQLQQEIQLQQREISALRQSEERYRDILENANDLIHSLDSDGNFLYVNKLWRETLGYSSEEAGEMKIFDIVDASCQSKCVSIFSCMMKGHETAPTETIFVGKDGRKIMVEGRCSVKYESGKAIELLGIFRDISERKKVETELLESQSLLSESQRIAGLGSYMLDIPSGLWSSTDVLDNLFGLNKGYERSVKGWLALIHPDDRKMMTDYFRNEVLAQGKPFDKEYRIVRYDDGDERWVHGLGKLEFNAQGQPLKMHGTIQDITGRKELETQLFQAQKLESIGTLAGGIAHDFNNILTAILGFAEIAQMDLPEGNPSIDHLKQIHKAGSRAKELVKQILTFSRIGLATQQPMNPTIIIKEGLKLIRASLPTTIEIREEIDPDCGSIIANPTNIHQVLVNLCTNALQAMEEETGILTIKLRRVELKQTEAAFAGVSAGPFVELEESDTGCGMDPKTKERIFEPYFTTKEVGKGSGMGLALVHGIVQGCGGFIKVDSEPGKGSTFRVSFPAIKHEPAIDPDERQLESLPMGDGRILAVDDEEVIVGMYKTILERLGYKVTAHFSCEKLLEEFRLAPDSFDLIISDQTMPHLPGSELAKQVLQIRSDMPIILCTGYSSMISEERAKDIGIAKFLMKPVSRRDLAVAVREVLDTHKARNA